MTIARYELKNPVGSGWNVTVLGHLFLLLISTGCLAVQERGLSMDISLVLKESNGWRAGNRLDSPLVDTMKSPQYQRRASKSGV